MNEMEKYLDAIEAAIEANDREAIAMLDSFATHLYKRIYANANSSQGEERVVWEGLRQRVQLLIAKMAKAGPEIW